MFLTNGQTLCYKNTDAPYTIKSPLEDFCGIFREVGLLGSLHPSAHFSRYVFSGLNLWTRHTGGHFSLGILGFMRYAFLCAKNKLGFQTLTNNYHFY